MGKLYKKYWILVIIFTIISLFSSLLTDCQNGYELIFLIPLTYLILFVFNTKLHFYSQKYIGIFMLNFMMFLKFSFSILLIVIFKDFYTPSYYTINISSESFSFAILYMLEEMVSVFLTIALFSQHLYHKNKSIENNNGRNNSVLKFEKIKIGPALFIILSVLFVVVITNIKTFIPKNMFFFNNPFTDDLEASNIIQILFTIFKTLVMGILINICIVNYQDSGKKTYIYFSYLVIFLFCLLNTSISRRNMVLPLLLFVLITKDIYKKKGIIMLVIIILILTSSLLAITIYKSNWMYNLNSSTGYVVKNSLGGIQEYTSNIRPIAIGIEMLNNYKGKINIKTFINDFTGSIPIISHYVNQNNRINYYYNHYILNGINTSQISPMIIVGRAYLGMFFLWIPTTICIILLMYFESNIYTKEKKRNFLERYMDLYLFFVFVSALDSNTQMIFSRLIINYIPIALIIKINKYINYTRRDSDENV